MIISKKILSYLSHYGKRVTSGVVIFAPEHLGNTAPTRSGDELFVALHAI